MLKSISIVSSLKGKLFLIKIGRLKFYKKSYIYAGLQLLSTFTKSGSTEVTEYHHPDRLGTRLITNPTGASQVEQLTLPFGTSIDAETSGTSNQRFTSYDRSDSTGLDYAVNRTYNAGQSRFTQVDPIGMASASIGNPQSLNMYAYITNNPIDFVEKEYRQFRDLWNLW
jgi:RHS repeat-associated protein